jgi:hypothetical protein
MLSERFIVYLQPENFFFFCYIFFYFGYLIYLFLI